MTTLNSQRGLARTLLVDAATCAAMGLLLLVAAGPIARLTGIPLPLLFYAGALLIPIAVYMAAVARLGVENGLAVWLVILGNIGWVAASLGLFAFISPNWLGIAFILAQGVVVGTLAWLEYIAWRAGGAGQRSLA